MTLERSRLLLDELMPSFDAAIAEHSIVRTDPAVAFVAARELDFLSVHSPLVDVAMWARGLPARLTGAAVEAPQRLVLGRGDPLPGWLVLGEEPGLQLAFGAVGTFWRPDIQWRDVESDEFASFAEPGWGKLAAEFSVVPYGEGTILTYECRTVTTDADSRRRFLRYWWMTRPFIRHIFRATVRTIGADAERSASSFGSEPGTSDDASSHQEVRIDG